MAILSSIRKSFSAVFSPHQPASVPIPAPVPDEEDSFLASIRDLPAKEQRKQIAYWRMAQHQGIAEIEEEIEGR